MTKRKTDADFKQEIEDLVGSEYTFLDTYVNTHTKLRVKHNKCGHIYEVSPSHFIRGSRCSYCSGKAKKTDADFKKEIYNLVGDDYTFLDSYINARTTLRVKHEKCNNIYEVQPYAFLQGKRCPYCFGNPKKTDADFKKEAFGLVGDEYTFLDAYDNAYTKIRVKHNECGNIYEVKPNNFLNGSRCPYCSAGTNKTDAKFKQEVYDLVGSEYTFLDPYVNNCTKLRVKHNKCGNTYEVRPTDFISHSTRCPYCNSPKGELIISRILDALNINYAVQKKFENLKDTQPLSYDFFIPSQSILIEYQGVQHYQPVDHFGGKSKFKIQQKHDKMKASYAKIHNYKLIAVPYTEDNFSKIKKYLIKHGLTK